MKQILFFEHAYFISKHTVKLDHVEPKGDRKKSESSKIQNNNANNK